MRFLACSLVVLAALSASARTRAVASRVDAARSILVITAHPDDEILIAPLLASRCIRGGARCSFLVMTTGNAAGLGEIRAGEMARSAALLNARLMQWTFSDVMENVGAAWEDEAGNRATLVHRIADVIATEKPDMILTLDPRHGTTGHPAHREIGRLVLETGANDVFLIETAARFVGNGFELSNAEPVHAWVFVANDDWQYAVRVAEIHATQFTHEQVESLRTLPIEQRRVWFMPECAPCLRPSPIATSTIR
ncbi:MAG TPA: PIG-L family deacetylase [Thermoanaerobaculia bacterium]|nr:PIG-L family deacetylase [Thermoanaerobaculia bacterium]